MLSFIRAAVVMVPLHSNKTLRHRPRLESLVDTHKEKAIQFPALRLNEVLASVIPIPNTHRFQNWWHLEIVRIPLGKTVYSLPLLLLSPVG